MRSIVAVALTLLSITSSYSAGPAAQALQPARAPTSIGQAGDIEALAFIVLMEAAKSAQEDLKAIMAHVKAINDAKARLRANMSEAQALQPGPCAGAAALRDCIRQAENKLMKMEVGALDLMRGSVTAAQADAGLLQDSLRHAPEEADRNRKHLPPPARIIPPNPCRGWNKTFWKQCVVLMKAELSGNLPDASSQAAIDAQIDQLKQDIDSMSELGEMESLRLQMAMDRLSKLMSTLSNLLKKISDTSSAITQNLK